MDKTQLTKGNGLSRVFLLIGMAWCLLCASLVQADNKLVFGVYSYQSPESVKEQYQGLSDYLSDSIDGASVEMKVMGATELRLAVRNGEIDLIFPNPSLYEIIRNESDTGGVLATVEMLRNGQPSSMLGGVMFSLADRDDLINIHSLEGKMIAIPTLGNTGAYRVPLYEAVQSGVNRDTLRFMQTGNNDSVVQAILDGKADVGFVRNGILENWIVKGKLTPEQVKIINAKQVPGFPYWHSTELFPEWPFLVSSHVDHDIVRQIAVALFSLDRNHPAAKQARIAGFVPPVDYLPLEKLFRKLRLFPYDQVPEFSLAEAIQKHSLVFGVSTFVFVLVVIAFIVSLVMRKSLKDKTEKLDELMFATQAITWEWHLESGKINVNERWADLIGYTLSELPPTNLEVFASLMPAEDVKKAEKIAQEHFDGKRDSFESEMRFKHKAGHWVWVLSRGRVVEWNADGSPLRMAGTYTAIDELKSKERLLRLNMARDEALIQLPEAADRLNEQEFMQYGQELTENLTQSVISFIHFLNEDQESIELVTWSKRTLNEYCTATYDEHYPLKEAGVWADAARQKQPVLINDYAHYAGRRGLPEGHAPLERMVSVPVIEGGRVVMLTGVGNKAKDYSVLDVETVQLISNEIWRLVQRKRALQKISDQTKKFQRLVNDLGQNYVVFSHSGEAGELSYVSETVRDVCGIDAEAAIGKSWAQIIDWDTNSLEEGVSKVKRLVDGVEDYNQLDMTFEHPQAGKRTLRVSQHAVRDSNGVLQTIDGLAANITDEIIAGRKLEEAAKVFEYAQEGILIVSPEGNILNVNEAFTTITGYAKEEVLGRNPRILSSGRQDASFYKQMWETLLEQGTWHGEIWNRRKDGEVYPQKINMTVVRSERGDVEQFIALFSDISVQKLQQAELEFIAHFDPLTKLPNRTLLTDRLSQAVAHSERHQHLLSVAFIDLDGFKEVNDAYGHQAGDFLLEEIAQRFNAAIRKEDTIARIGGDEFVAVFVELGSIESLTPVLKRLLEDASRPVIYEGSELSVSASIGVATYDGQVAGMSADMLIRQADQAMYHSKLAGKNQFATFDDIHKTEVMNAAEKNKQLEEIESAMEAGEFELYYQPKLNVKTGKLLAFEALARWQHPEQGLLGPFKFLPILEGQPLGKRFGYWVIETALEHIKVWQEEGKDFGVSVNIDGYLLEQDDFVEQLGFILQRYNKVDPSKLTLELLESSALDDIDQVTRVIEQVRTFGVRMAIDDFGSGYASLSYLKQLPVNELKIDQSFIKDIFEKPQGLAILEGVISMSQAFNVLIVAEGVETEEHIDLLLKLGVEYMQGYAISRPMEADVVLQWLSDYQSKEGWKSIEALNRDEIVMLMAILEHKAWTRNVIDSVKDAKSSGVELSSPYTCGFGRWLYSHGKSHLSRERFYELELTHNEIHQVGGAIMRLKHDGNQQGALEKLQKFVELKEHLLEVLEV